MDTEKVPVVDPALLDWMRKIRRTLHQQPELSFKEYRTSALIQEKLAELSIEFKNGWGGTGVIGTVGDMSLPVHVGLRADMDALPIQDEKSASYASKIHGVMHACGHDGHVAMLLGAAALLKKYDVAGRVSLIFQPAEEHGNGAEKIIQQGALEDGINAVFAGHIDTHYPTGTMTVDEGIICSSADPFSLHIAGRSAHAARPHEAQDAIVAGAHLVTALQTLVSRDTDPNHSAVLTIGRFHAGHAHNVIAGDACIEGTIRSNDKAVRINILSGLQRICDGIGHQFNVKITVQFHDCLPVVINSSVATNIARRAAQLVLGTERVISQGRPSLGGEDFSFYQQVVDGCLVRFGAGSLEECGPAHSGTFDFDENVMGIGAAWLACVALQWLRKNGERSCDGNW
ncbi:MAG: M20 family metallopeptidase [Desulforhopalus sp.]